MQNLFVYGTLMQPELWQRLLRRDCQSAPATLSGYRRLQVKAQHYPGLIPCRGDSVAGLVYFDLSAKDMKILDRYEGEQYEHHRVTVQLQNGDRLRATTYLYRKRFRSRLRGREWHPRAIINRP